MMRPSESEPRRLDPDSVNAARAARAEIAGSLSHLKEEEIREDERLAGIAKPMLRDAAKRLLALNIFPQEPVMQSADYTNGTVMENLLFVIKFDETIGWSTKEFYLTPEGELLRLERIIHEGSMFRDRNPQWIHKRHLAPGNDRDYRQFAKTALIAVDTKIADSLPNSIPASANS